MMSLGCPAVQEGGNKSMPMSSKEEQLTNRANEPQRRRVGAKQLFPLIFPAVCNVLSIVIQVGGPRRGGLMLIWLDAVDVVTNS
jgi:hypothetical protein